ncbi:MAG: hypothetical protein GWO81_06330 [Verrucomicrobia bacterium]|nr:hypothetical protein [Verrucomicrobiota bacterium]
MKYSLAIAALSALTVLAGTAHSAPLANAQILNVGGTVTIHQGGDAASAQALRVGDTIVQGDVITTGSQSTAKLAFSNGSVIEIDPNSQLELEIIRQNAFSGQKTYQQLDRDPSQSITLLNMNYGSLFGHVKKLTETSKFNIKTPLGVAVIKGTRFRVSFKYDSLEGDFRFSTNNIDGIVEVITATDGENVDYGMQSNADVRLATNTDVPSDTVLIPPAHTVTVKLSASDPGAEEIVDFDKNLSPQSDAPIVKPPTPPIINDPDDSEIPSRATD